MGAPGFGAVGGARAKRRVGTNLGEGGRKET